jgi:Tim44-like domain
MLSYFSEQLAGNASRGLINRVTDVKLLQGDLAETWREGRADYATVAMKYALKDSMVERATRRTVEGGERTDYEVTELWTFMRASGGSQPSSRRDTDAIHRLHQSSLQVASNFNGGGEQSKRARDNNFALAN